MMVLLKRWIHRAGASRHAWAVFAAALATGAAWMAVIPPFEGPDEFFFYSQALRVSQHPQARDNLFYKLSAPIVRRQSLDGGPVNARYNPAFRFVGNVRGEVNLFVHDRPVATREHVRTLMALRWLVVLMGAITALLIYGIASLCLAERPLAWIVVGLSIWIPQVSFMNVIAQREAITQALGAALTLVIVARTTGHLNRWTTSALVLAGVTMVPFADRQAYFLVPFAAIGLIAAERGWVARAAAVGATAIPAVAAIWLVSSIEAGTNLGPWTAILGHPFRPFLEAAHRNGVPSLSAYYLFEFLPKMFMGFWGWLGAPSILLPAPVYGTMAALSILSLVGLLLRVLLTGPNAARSEDERRRLRARRLLAMGVALMFGPIIYGPVVADLNLWYGRWLFPMLGPIVIGFVLGLAQIVQVARRWPHRLALGVAIVSVIAGVLWITSPGDAARAGIMANHYGDRPRLIETIRDAIAVLGMTSIAIWLSANVRTPKFRLPIDRVIVLGVAGVNATLLFGFVRPLYAPLTPDDYIGLVDKYSAQRELERAADVYASAITSYPLSPQLAELGDRSPRLLLGGRLEETFGLLQRRFAQGATLRDHDALLALAARLRGATWNGSEAVRAVLSDAEAQPDLAEPVALVRMELDHRASEGDAAVRLIEAGRGTRLMTSIRNGEMLLEGFTTHMRHEDRTELVVYLRPNTDANNRRVWLHAYPEGSEDYLVLEPTIAPTTWRPGELIWQVFELPPGRFNMFLGVWVGTDIGRGEPLGPVPR
jgi:hypothetical protein